MTALKRSFVSALLLLSVPGALTILVVIRRASSYQGKPAIEWFEEMKIPREADALGAQPPGLDALRKIGKRALPPLQRAIKSGPRWERIKAAWALGRLGPVATNAIPSLVQALDDSDPVVRYYAVRSLTQLGAAEEKLVPKLLSSLGDSNRMVCNAAGELVSKIEQDRLAKNLPVTGSNELDDALAFVRSPSVRIRLLGLERLANMARSNGQVVAALQSLLSDEVEAVRRRAAKALNPPAESGTNRVGFRQGFIGGRFPRPPHP